MHPEIRRYTSVADLPLAIRDGTARDGVAGFFSRSEWFSCLASVGFEQKPALLLLAGHGQAGRDRQTCILWLQTDRRNGRLRSLTNHYTIHYPGLVGPETHAPEIAARMLGVLAGESSPWSEIELRNLSLQSPNTILLKSALVAAGWRVELFHHHWNWYVDVTGRSFGEYLAARPARLRNTLRRRFRQAGERHALRLEVAECERKLPAALAEYQRVYALSWKEPEFSSAFIPALMHVCAGSGALRLGILYLDEQAVAVQFWIVADETAYIYKLAHDPAYESLSVGSLLTAHMFEQAIDVWRVSEIDFGIGNEAYKRDWMEHRRQLVGLQALNPDTVRGRLLLARQAVRNLLRRLGLRAYTPVDNGPKRSRRDPEPAG